MSRSKNLQQNSTLKLAIKISLQSFKLDNNEIYLLKINNLYIPLPKDIFMF